MVYGAIGRPSVNAVISDYRVSRRRDLAGRTSTGERGELSKSYSVATCRKRLRKHLRADVRKTHLYWCIGVKTTTKAERKRRAGARRLNDLKALLSGAVEA